MHPIDPKHIVSFKTALEAGTIRAAADRLQVEPSTISRNIASLEKHLATALIERGRKGVQATEAGLLLLEYAQRQTGELEALRSQLDALSNMERGAVSVAIGEGFVSDFFQSALLDFTEENPNITFSLDVGATEHVSRQVAQDFCHLGLAYNVAPDPKLKVLAKVDQPLALICKAGGRFDRSGSVSIRELLRLPCGILSKGYGVGTAIAEMEASNGFRAHATLETSSIAALKSFVRADIGVTLLPAFVVSEEVKTKVFVSREIAVSDIETGAATFFVRQGRRLPLAAQKLIQPLISSLIALQRR